jgi:hypothetical protein
MDKFEDAIEVLNLLAETLAATKDQGDKAIENAIDLISAIISDSLTGDDDDCEEVFDVMLNYVVDKSRVYIDS